MRYRARPAAYGLPPQIASTASDWGISEGFDGFGNRNAQNLTKGSAPTFSGSFNAANNQMVGASYDANGNITSFSGTQVSYLVNDMPYQIVTGAGTEQYAYDPWNRRVWKKYASGNEELYVYGVGGKRLATFTVTVPNGTLTLTPEDMNVHFGGRMIRSRGVSTILTRLNHVKAWSCQQTGASSTNYLPYGEELTTTAQDREKFGSYVRDSASGIDCAHNRYYASSLGRFLTPDKCDGSVRISEPDSWNRYSFVSNDPMNSVDPSGLDDDYWDSGDYYDDGGGGGGGGSYIDDPPSIDPGPTSDPLASLLDPSTSSYYLITDTVPAIQLANSSALSIDQINALQNGFDAAWNFLASNAAVQNLFTVNPIGDPLQVLMSTSYRYLPFGDSTAGMETIGPWIVFINSQIVGNPNVTFGLPGTNGPLNVGPFGNLGSSDPSTIGIMLLHELGHQLDIIGADSGPATWFSNGGAQWTQQIFDAAYGG